MSAARTRSSLPGSDGDEDARDAAGQAGEPLHVGERGDGERAVDARCRSGCGRASRRRGRGARRAGASRASRTGRAARRAARRAAWAAAAPAASRGPKRPPKPLTSGPPTSEIAPVTPTRSTFVCPRGPAMPTRCSSTGAASAHAVAPRSRVASAPGRSRASRARRPASVNWPVMPCTSCSTEPLMLEFATWTANSSATPAAIPARREQLLQRLRPQPPPVEEDDRRRASWRVRGDRPRLDAPRRTWSVSLPSRSTKRAVGEVERGRVVRGEQHADALAVADLGRAAPSTARPLSLSRLPVGSSASSSFGSFASARAIATRWRSPADSFAGWRARLRAEPDARRATAAHARRASRRAVPRAEQLHAPRCRSPRRRGSGGRTGRRSRARCSR